MRTAKRSIQSPVMKLMRAQWSRSLCPPNNCFLGRPKIASTAQCGVPRWAGWFLSYSVWQYPDVFGGAICMSSAFSYKDDLIQRVLTEPRRDVVFYLDSGWPNDNYEETIAMALALISRGWRYGCDLVHLSFPHAAHDEKAWGVRLHLPMQFFSGVVARASRSSDRARYECANTEAALEEFTNEQQHAT
jgi:hypothetical protein